MNELQRAHLQFQIVTNIDVVVFVVVGVVVVVDVAVVATLGGRACVTAAAHSRLKHALQFGVLRVVLSASALPFVSCLKQTREKKRKKKPPQLLEFGLRLDNVPPQRRQRLVELAVDANLLLDDKRIDRERRRQRVRIGASVEQIDFAAILVALRFQQTHVLRRHARCACYVWCVRVIPNEKQRQQRQTTTTSPAARERCVVRVRAQSRVEPRQCALVSTETRATKPRHVSGHNKTVTAHATNNTHRTNVLEELGSVGFQRRNLVGSTSGQRRVWHRQRTLFAVLTHLR